MTAATTETSKRPGNLGERIEQLKKQQAEQLKERHRVAKELRNAERRRRRLKDRAKGLSDADLAAVIALRAALATKLSEKAAAAASSSSVSAAPAEGCT
jgi:cytochrome c553